MAEGVEPMDETQDTEVKTQQPTGPLRRGSRSVLKVSQLLLRAIASHKRLTLAALKKEFGNAGYEVRRNCGRLSGEKCRSEGKSLLLRVSGSEAAGYFRIWKVPKPKRKPGRPRLEEGGRSPRTPLGARNSGRRSARRTVARKVRRGRSRADSRKVRSRAKDLVNSRTKEEGRAKKEDIRPKSRNAKRPSSKAREEKKQDPEKPVKRTAQRPTSSKTDRTPHGQAKTCDPRATRTKTSAKAEGARSATRSP